MDAVARLDAVGVDLPLAEVYAGVTFKPEEEVAETGTGEADARAAPGAK